MWALASLEGKRRAESEKAFAIASEKNESASHLQTPGAIPKSCELLMSQNLRIEPATSANLSQLFGEADLPERSARVRAIQTKLSG